MLRHPVTMFLGLAAAACILATAIVLMVMQTYPAVTPEGCYVITDSLGHVQRSTRVPTYNVQVGAVQWQTSLGEGTIFGPVALTADYACLDANPAPTPEGS